MLSDAPRRRAVLHDARPRVLTRRALSTTQVVLPALPAVDASVAKAVAPPAAVAGGVVAGALAVQYALRKLAASVTRTATVALFGAAVGAAAFKIIGLL